MTERTPVTTLAHPAGHLSKACIRAFEAIAINLPPRCKPTTFQRLLDEGLVERGPDKLVGRDAFGAIAIPQYEVPIRHHMAWCSWCAAQPGMDDDDG